MPVSSPGRPSLTVVDDGPGPDIPGIPIDPPSGRPCRIQAFLRGIYYDANGGDVGSRWRFRLAVNGGVWAPPTRNLHHGQWDPVNVKVYDEVRPGGCTMTQLITIFIRARELDWCLFDDIGEHLELTALPCEDEATRRKLIVTVFVPEYGLGWLRWLFRRFKKVARLLFILEIETQCQP